MQKILSKNKFTILITFSGFLGICLSIFIFFSTLLILYNKANLPPEFETHEITIDGDTRTYELYIPDSASDHPSLLILLHGALGSGRQISDTANIAKFADEKGFIVIAPNGYQRVWNVGFRKSKIFQNGKNDVKFIDSLIDLAINDYNVKDSKVYVAGFSNGAIFSHKLACELSGKIAGIAAISGNIMSELFYECDKSKPIPVLIFNGEKDPIVSYNGGVTERFTQGELMSVEDTMNFWVDNNGCSSEPIYTEIANINTADNSQVEKYSYTDCEGSSKVELYKIIDGGHTWPNETTKAINILTGNINRDIDATEIITDEFF